MERREYRRRDYYRKVRRKRRRNILAASAVTLAIVVCVIIYGASFLYQQLFEPMVAESYDMEAYSENVLDTGTYSESTPDVETYSESTPDVGAYSERTPNIGADNESVSGIGIDLTHLYSPYAILVDLDSGSVLEEHNAQERIYPASLTKIMTAILAIENTADMEEIITVPSDFFDALYVEEASMAGFQPGERARLKDLLYGILLPSGAECCMTFADRIAGSEEAFTGMMNQKAEELGLKNTHFCNVTGLHDPDHYSTVEDISILLQYALKNDYFRAAFTSSRYSTIPSDYHPEGFTFFSTMFQYMDSAQVTGGEILGGKTGYTEEAGQCLASLAAVGGKEYILVTAKANGSHQTEQFHILDAENVYSQIGGQRMP